MFILAVLVASFEVCLFFLPIFLLVIFIRSFIVFISVHKNYPTQMTFNQFRRIYELNPNKWYINDDYICERKEWVELQSGMQIEKEVIISMKTFFDFLRLILWNTMDNIKNKKKTRCKESLNDLKTLSEMINKDVEENQERVQRKIEKLMGKTKN